MSKYSIYHRIHTPAYINDPFEIQGFSFQQWHFTYATGPTGDSWVVQKTVEANNGMDAINIFRKDLLKIIDRASAISQCQINMLFEAFSVKREDGNADGTFFFRCAYIEDMVTGLSFDGQEVEALNESFKLGSASAFEYLHEANNSTSYLSRLIFLILALEAFAGEVEDDFGNLRTNKEFIKKEILRDEDLYKSIYQYGDGIRNKIFHGSSIRAKIQPEEINYVESIYKKILSYLKRNKIHIEPDVVSPGRNFFGNYRAANMWLKPKDVNKEFNFQDLFQTYKDIFDDNRAGGDHPDYNEVHPALKIDKY